METFVLRIFVPARRERLPLAGVIEHVGSGRKQAFQDQAELLDVVLHQLELDQLNDLQKEEER
jgi:hypothetical protein